MQARRATAAPRYTEPTRRWLALALVAAGGLAATEVCAEGAPFYAESFEKVASEAALRSLGRALFFDASLSASGRTACATCHDPAHAFAAANGSSVQRGGAGNRRVGVRAVPSLTYTQNIPPFTQHFFDSGDDDGVDQGPAGGRGWDGRAQSAHEQARLPLFSPYEMANAGPEAVVAKVRGAPYVAQFRAAFGEGIFADPARAFKAVLLALEIFEQTPEMFYP